MDLERLKTLGFTLMCGQVDYKGKNYGIFNHHGALLTDEGDALVERLEDEAAREAKAPKTASAPAAKTGRKKAEAAPVEPVDPVPESTASEMEADLNGLLGQE